LIHNINILIKTLKKQHSKRTKILLHDENNNYNYTYFLLAKYITLGECDVVKDDYKISDILNVSDKDRILHLIDAIIEIMNNKLNIYEYQLENENNFTMKSTTNEDTYDRSTPFVLFEQEQDSNNHTNVFISDLQLSNDKKGGKKKQKKQRYKMSRKKQETNIDPKKKRTKRRKINNVI